jgi:hypothetical protein
LSVHFIHKLEDITYTAKSDGGVNPLLSNDDIVKVHLSITLAEEAALDSMILLSGHSTDEVIKEV